MLTLNDGRAELWQWDTCRTLSVDADCSQVHFSNRIIGRSIDVDVIDGVAIIPDILLQTDKDLNVWAFVGAAENGYTKISKIFKVNRRNKPADYVFTPQEQILLKDAIAIVETAKSAANDAIESAKQAEASAEKAGQIADEMKKLADQVEQNTEVATQAKTDAQTAQNKAETAQSAAETARQAAEDAVNSTGANVEAAETAAARAEAAESQAAAALTELQTLYQQMQEYVAQAVLSIQTAGNTQVERVATEGTAQVSAAKEQADRAVQAAEIAQAAAGSLQPEVNQIKDDLANKLPKSPADWESWTAEEQAVARERIGASKKLGIWEDIATVNITEDAVAITVNLDANGNTFSLSDIICEITIPAEKPVKQRSIYFGLNISTNFTFSKIALTTNERYITGAITYARIVSDRVICDGAISGPSNTRYQPYYKYAIFNGYGGIEAESFDSVSVFTYNDAFPAGTTVILKGIRT